MHYIYPIFKEHSKTGWLEKDFILTTFIVAFKVIITLKVTITVIIIIFEIAFK